MLKSSMSSTQMALNSQRSRPKLRKKNGGKKSIDYSGNRQISIAKVSAIGKFTTSPTSKRITPTIQFTEP